MRDWISCIVVLGCTLLTAAMLGFVGLQPVELSVQRAEQVSRESRQMMTFALRDIQFAIAREAELELRVKRLEQALEKLEDQ